MMRWDRIAQKYQADPLEGPPDELGYHWTIRLLALRRARRIGPVFVEGGGWFIGEMEFSSWHHKQFYTREKLRALIVELEADAVRIGPQSEKGESHVGQLARAV